MTPALLAALAALAAALCVSAQEPPCEVFAAAHAGALCGARRRSANGAPYASFLGVPYAQQPLKDLRFRELQPLEPWEGVLNATKEGPVCPQVDVFYKGLQQARGGMDEACIHANIHAPTTEDGELRLGEGRGFPVLVFIHGGGFSFGSGDTDLHGAEYLLDRDVVVITFNYRLNILGFLSLNNSYIPGNNGLRDALTLLRWVQREAPRFGGDPGDVTLAGQSAGAVMAHTLSLSPQATGLFHRVIAMSGVATSDFFSSSPVFAKTVADAALAMLGVDPALGQEDVYRRLVDAPLEELMAVTRALLDVFGLTTFVPVVESSHPGVVPVLPLDPEVMARRGAGARTPLALGFTDAECETFAPRLHEFGIAAKLNATPGLFVTPRLTYLAKPASLPLLRKLSWGRYARREAERGFVRFCSDAFYAYPALRVAAQRRKLGAPTYLYKFTFVDPHSPVRCALGSRGAAGHVEDLTYVFRASFACDAPPSPNAKRAVHDMTCLFYDFMNPPAADCSCRWAPGAGAALSYQVVDGSGSCGARPLSPEDRDLVGFFDRLYRLAESSTPSHRN